MLDTTRCQAEFEAAEALAKSLGGNALETWERNVAFLRDFRGGTTTCELSKDFAPHSFIWVLPEMGLCGGLIFYGEADGNGTGAPQYSVSLSGETGARWEIHS